MTRLMPWLILLMPVLASPTLGCSKQSQESGAPSDASAADGPTNTSKDSSAPLPLVLGGPYKVMTNADVLQPFGLHVSSGPVSIYSDLILSHSVFVRDDGATVAPKMDIMEQIAPDFAYRITLAPSLALDANRWYALKITADDQVHVGSSEQPIVTSGTWTLPFFTGSAPHVASVKVSPKNPLMLDVDFSEPIELSTLAPETFAVQSGSVISKCFLIANTCSSTSWATDVAEIGLNVSVDVARELDLVLAATTMGGGKTVGDSATSAGYGPELTTKGLVTAVSSSSWTDCQSGAAKCWKWTGPPTFQK